MNPASFLNIEFLLFKNMGLFDKIGKAMEHNG